MATHLMGRQRTSSRRSTSRTAAAARGVVTALLVAGALVAGPARAQEQITFWHSMGGQLGEALNVLVDRFNEQNKGKIKVTAIFQGAYADALAKLKASIQSKQLPELVQVNEIGSRLIYDLKITVPFENVAAANGLDPAELMPGIAAYYTVGGKLLSMPFNASAPVLYYNKTAFKEAGLDPEKPPRTLQEVRAAADKLLVKTGDRTTRYGFVAAVDGWLVEQFYGRYNIDYCNHGNGRDALATTVNWNNPDAKALLEWWARIMRDGVGLNAGRQNNDAVAAFTSGRAAMMILTSAPMRSIINDSKFEVGVTDYPQPAAGKNGQVLNGGASVWIVAGHSAAKQAAAARFAAYLGSPETQATWSVNTGYVPVNRRSIALPQFKDAITKTPALMKPVVALAGVASTPASRGCFMGVMPQARNKMNEIIEAVIQGTAPEKALADGTTAIEPAIKSYNRAIGK